MRSARILFLSVVVVVAGLPVSAQQPKPYDSFYTFGDSLGDNGNLMTYTALLRADPAIPPSVSPHRTYFQGRFSNGPVAFEYLWWMIKQKPFQLNGGLQPFLKAPVLGKTGAVNFAFGGSTTGPITELPGGIFIPGLQGQVALFKAALLGKKPSSRALYAIIAGANDYFGLPNIPDGGQQAVAAQVVGNIAQAVAALHKVGARNLVLIDLPDLGAIPLVAFDPERAASLSRLSTAHNVALAAAIPALEAALPGLNIIPIELANVLGNLPPGIQLTPAIDSMLDPPVALGGLPMSVCLFVAPQFCEDVPTFNVGVGFLFWDAEHPTTAIHQALAQYLYFAIQSN